MSNSTIIKISVAVYLLLICLTANAQNVAQSTPESTSVKVEKNADDETQTRIKQLELQVQAMKEQIESLKNLVVQSPKTVTVAGQTENKAGVVQIDTTAKVETKQTSPTNKSLGVDIGSARLTPYGTIYFNAFNNSGGTNNEDVPLFATPTGSSNTSASVRQTRLGLKLEGAKVGNAGLSAILEADFFGGFPAVGIGENFGVMRVRLANARLDWEKTSVTVGQDWMLFAPVNPTSLAATAIPQMAAAGNNWARLPQIKVERKFGKNFTWAGAILAPQTGDSTTTAAFFLQPTSGANSQIPFIQTRIAFADTNWLGAKKNGSIGLSVHYGRSRVFTGTGGNIKNDIDSLGLALDWNFPLAERVSLSGEAFFGRNLGGFQAGVFQSYNNDFAYRNGATIIPGGVRSIATRGGWAQLGFTPDVLRNRLGIYASIGIDDPRNDDLITRTPRDFRTQNFAFAGDLIYKFTPQFQIGAEFRRLQTLYLLSNAQHADHINLTAAYSF